MSKATSATVTMARDYYNSADADNFYTLIWGGEDIHVGLYAAPDESISVASRRTVKHLAEQIEPISEGTRVLDLGSGYGGAARYQAGTYGAQVTALNLSEVENERHRRLNQGSGLSDRIEVIDGNFENSPCDNLQFEVVWSQDALLHSGDRPQVMREVGRVLKPGGQFIFTDLMQADDCPQGVLPPILDRIHLNSLGSLDFYRTQAVELGWSDLGFGDYTQHLVTHYQRVGEETAKAGADLVDKISSEYIERMQKGLWHWVEGGRAGHLVWGVMQFCKE